MEAIKNLISSAIKYIHKQKQNPSSNLTTGFTVLDQMIKCFQDGDLIAITGFEGIGKTVFALNLLKHFSIDNKFLTAYLSMNTSSNMLIKRLFAIYGNIDLSRIENGQLDASEIKNIEEISNLLSEKPIYIDDTTRLSLSEICEKANKMKKAYNAKVLIIDHLQSIRLDEKLNLNELDFTKISKSLKILAQELKIIIIVLANLHMDSFSYIVDHVEPRITDLKDAIGLERYADSVLMLDRKNYYIPEKKAAQTTKAKVIVTKNKNGPTGFAVLDYYNKSGKFEDLSHVHS